MAAGVRSNDGAMVLVLFCMAMTAACAMLLNVATYAASTVGPSGEGKARRVVRLVSGFSNLGNGAMHLILVCYMKANEDNTSVYWVQEQKLGGWEGPLAIACINGIVGLVALRSSDKYYLSVGWNGFVAVVGTAVPMVWQRFISEGLDTWPHVTIFIWFFIFAVELAAVTTSMAWSALTPSPAKGKKGN